MPSPISSPVATFIRFAKGDPTIVIGDFVCIEAGQNDTVIKADPTDATKMPAIGIVKSSGSSTVVVQLDYEYTLPVGYSASISAGAEIYLDPNNPGKIIATPPESGILQKIGVAKSTTKLLLNIEEALISL